jgi:hypothetical protein
LATEQRNHLFRNHTALAVAAAQAHHRGKRQMQPSLLENLSGAQPVRSTT